jgi:hypothetical protein
MKNQMSSENKNKITTLQLFSDGIKNTFNFFSKILALLFPFTIIKELHEAFDYIRNNLFLSVISGFCFFVLFLWQIFMLIKKNETYFNVDFEKIRKLRTTILSFRLKKLAKFPKLDFKKVFGTVAVLSSITSIVLIIVFAYLISSKDAYYVVIASQPNERSAVKYIERLNETFEKRGIRGFEARAYASGGGNAWYMISLNTSYFSKVAAEQALQQAKENFGELIPNDAYIYTSSKVPIIRKFLSIIYSMLQVDMIK